MNKRELRYEVDANGCHVCVSHAANREGYPLKKIGGKYKLLHRLIYEEVHGKLVDGLIIMHTCDNPRCVNVVLAEK